jgi:RHH-type transcriptional regulator, proline utilization regulon repressor / proline dehydrogenase / delta 1-pyrroline-5-carboxylate dehydrogenase
MENASYFNQAIALIKSVKGKATSPDLRSHKAIDLAALLLKEALHTQTSHDRRHQTEIARLMEDPLGKAFTAQVTDQCFRSKDSKRAADQLVYTLKKFGVPKFFSMAKRFKMLLFKWFAKSLPTIFVPLTQRLIRQETSQVILPGENSKLVKHLQQRKKEKVRINLNRLGEAILGEDEALHRMELYLADLARPEIEYISVKISTIYSQLNLLSREHTLKVLSERLKRLYRSAQQHSYQRADGTSAPKFVNLDMEEYRDLRLTIDLFRNTLDDPEFLELSAGIVLQSYLPDSYELQQELTQWALQRTERGGAPIKIRIVKGANLAMEQVEASLRNWPQAPFPTKLQVDTNFKQMILYGCQQKYAKAVHLGIGSHNLFDIAYALLLRSENNVEPYVGFEMLEGMADPIRRVVQQTAGDMLLYCPAATQEEFQFAVAYLVRRLDENTAPDNFLRHAFSMVPGTKIWQDQAALFSAACEQIGKVDGTARRQQNRLEEPIQPSSYELFENEADTDWSLPQNCEWAKNILNEWSQRKIPLIPLVIGNKKILKGKEESGIDPSNPNTSLYKYINAESTHVNQALITAKSSLRSWGKESVENRCSLLGEVAKSLRSNRGELIGAMVANTGKTIPEADVEVSEAIDFAEYYRRSLEEIVSMQDLGWSPKGVVIVAPPWNFPCSIPAGCISAALAAGNTIIFKPAPEAVLVGWQLAQSFWEAGIPQDVLQFLPCPDEPIGSQLINDPRISAVLLTGSTNTAIQFLKMRPGLELIAETGGKNSIIVSNLSDRELAIKDIIQSAFGHAGQKCSACSLAICEAEVYDDPKFRKTLKDTASSLIVGSQWDAASRVNPLIKPPNPTLMKGLTQLEEGETWLLEPKQDQKNPNLWSPGIKLGVKQGSFTYSNELFGPVLAVMRAENLDHAIQLANGTPFGLTSGLHSLDEREHQYWIERIEAGNLYINRGITGAIVQRQPFGGCKQSSFGKGLKAGGPNYLIQLMNASQVELPIERSHANEAVRAIQAEIKKNDRLTGKLSIWNASTSSYAFFWNHYFQKNHDPSCLLGQDNFLLYVPHSQMTLRIQSNDDLFDILRIIAAAATCHLTLEISGDSDKIETISKVEWKKLNSSINAITETENQFIERMLQGHIKRLRTLSEPSQQVLKAAAEVGCNRNTGPVLANGRVELLHYLREVAVSSDYHRYGNLGTREGEKRRPLPIPDHAKNPSNINVPCGSQCLCTTL